MAHNHLEQLVAEWYEHRGYYVRRNVLVGKEKTGGYEGELDVVAFNPESRKLVHIESSMDAHSWKKREERFSKKFKTGRKYIPTLFSGIDLPSEIEQIALLGIASKVSRTTIGGGEIMLVSDLLRDILTELRQRRVASRAVPEQFPLLRTLQFVCEHRITVFDVLNPS